MIYFRCMVTLKGRPMGQYFQCEDGVCIKMKKPFSYWKDCYAMFREDNGVYTMVRVLWLEG